MRRLRELMVVTAKRVIIVPAILPLQGVGDNEPDLSIVHPNMYPRDGTFRATTSWYYR